RACKVEDDLFDVELSAPEFELSIEIMELTPEQWRTPTMLDEEVVAEDRLRNAIGEFGPLSGISPLFTPEEIKHLAAAPIEDWMVFLHPDQRAVVDRHYEGPARVRGSAGTGKTVVALHRAVSLAKRFRDESEEPRKILFTTFIK